MVFLQVSPWNYNFKTLPKIMLSEQSRGTSCPFDEYRDAIYLCARMNISSFVLLGMTKNKENAYNIELGNIGGVKEMQHEGAGGKKEGIVM